MRKLITLLLLSVYFLTLNAQDIDNLLVEEQFSDNSRQWFVVDNSAAEADIFDGVYKIYCKNIGKLYRVINQIETLNYLKAYKVEARIKLMFGQPEAAYGLIWQANGIDDYCAFEINGNGEFFIWKYKDGEYEMFVQNAHSSTILPDGQYNKLSVVRKNGYYYFFINDRLVHSTKVSNIKCSGNDVGFVVEDKTEIFIDNIKIFGIKPELRIVDSLSDVKLENLGPNVNTQFTETTPVISPDGQTLYFVRNGDPRNIGEDDNDDIWFCTKINDSTWSEAQNIGSPINNDSQNSIITVLPDNNTLIISGIYDMFGGFVSSNGISITHRQADGTWSIPEQLKIEDFHNDWEYQNFTMSPDLSVLIMAVERPEDTYGSSDLYVSFRKQDGSYTKPKNLGPVINTQGSEGTPMLAPDGVTLYFNSNGHPGYGDKDIFVSKRLDDTWTNWAEPLNLGPAINSEEFDAYFTVAADGKYAYLVSSKNTYGNEDIFRIKLSADASPEPVVLIYGKVYDAKTGQPLYAQITYTDLSSGQTANIAISNPQTGEYKIVLPYGKKYSFSAVKKGYFAQSDNIDLTQISTYKELKRDLQLMPIEEGQNIILKNVYFPAGSATLLSESYRELDRLVAILKANPEVRILISGHTNNLGEHKKLVELSQKRAEAVKKYLVLQGIDEKRIETKGYGPDKPIATNDTPEGRKKNQRVEFKIIK